MDTTSGPGSPELINLVRTPTVITIVVGLVASVIGFFVAGGKGLLGGLLATVVVVAFFSGGQLIVGRVLRSNPQVGMTAALLVYVLQILILMILLLVLRDATFLAPRVFAFTVLVCALVWIGGAVLGWSQARHVYVEPDRGDTPQI